jgi:hypothetical protein
MSAVIVAAQRAARNCSGCRALLQVIRANIKVSSTETGVIFGNIVYEGSGYAERSVVVLADIHIDIMDYISPASCPDSQFRRVCLLRVALGCMTAQRIVAKGRLTPRCGVAGQCAH